MIGGEHAASGRWPGDVDPVHPGVPGVDAVHEVAERPGAERRPEGDRQRAQRDGQPSARRTARAAVGEVAAELVGPASPGPAPGRRSSRRRPARPAAGVAPSRDWWTSSRTLAPASAAPARWATISRTPTRCSPSDAATRRRTARQEGAEPAVLLRGGGHPVAVPHVRAVGIGRAHGRLREGMAWWQEGSPPPVRLSRGIPNGVRLPIVTSSAGRRADRHAATRREILDAAWPGARARAGRLGAARRGRGGRHATRPR